MDVGVAYLLVGLCLLLAVFLSVTIRHYPVSAPMALVGIGMLVGLTPLVDGIDVDPVAHRVAIEHITEITVLVALMGVGLALDRPLSPRDRMSWRRWSPTWRLLFVAMPLCIGATALLGWGLLGLAPATALLVGAVLAPTDPVLASEVQVEGPQVGAEEEIDERDEVRFALTSEAGLNDGLAFPFVTGALLLAGAGSLAAGWAGGSPGTWSSRSSSASSSGPSSGECSPWSPSARPGPRSGWPSGATPCSRWRRCSRPTG